MVNRPVSAKKSGMAVPWSALKRRPVQDFNSFSIMFYYIISTTYQKIGDLFCLDIFLDFRTVCATTLIYGRFHVEQKENVGQRPSSLFLENTKGNMKVPQPYAFLLAFICYLVTRHQCRSWVVEFLLHSHHLDCQKYVSEKNWSTKVKPLFTSHFII